MRAEEISNEVSTQIMRASTRRVPRAQRFDFWRSLNCWVDLDLPDRRKAKDYQARLALCVASDGSTFGCCSSEDTIGRFSHPDGDFVMLSMAVQGQVLLQVEGNDEQIANPMSGLLVVDGTKGLTTRTEDFAHVYLTVPRQQVLDRIGAESDVLDKGRLLLPRSGLARFLEGHLQMLAGTGLELSAEAASVAMKVAVDLAIGALVEAKDARLPGIEHPQALLAAAERYIQLNIGNRHLTAALVSRAVGCSRSQLFRIFAGRGKTVGDFIEDCRFEHATAMLASNALPGVEQVAIACGFSSGSTFARAFRNRLGMSPTEFRNVHLH